MDASIGIGATGDETGYDRSRMIMQSETTYRVWSTVVEQAFGERKLWSHFMGTAVRPSPVLAISIVVQVVAQRPRCEAD